MCGILAVLKSPEEAETLRPRLVAWPNDCDTAVPTGAASTSSACSSAVALAWEEQWSGVADPSGRAIGTHTSAYSKKA